MPKILYQRAWSSEINGGVRGWTEGDKRQPLKDSVRGKPKMLWEQGGSIRPRTGGQGSLPGEGIFGRGLEGKGIGFECTGEGVGEGLLMPRPRGMNNGLKRRACVQE